MSHGSFLGCRMAPAGLLALAIVFGTFPDLTAQVGREGGGARFEIEGLPAPVGTAVINQAGQDGATLRGIVASPLMMATA